MRLLGLVGCVDWCYSLTNKWNCINKNALCGGLCIGLCGGLCIGLCIGLCGIGLCGGLCVGMCGVLVFYTPTSRIRCPRRTRNMYRLIKNTYQRTNRCGSSNISCASLLSSICYYLFHPFTRFFPSTNRNCVGVYLCVYLCVFVCVYLLVCVFVYLILFILLCHFCVTLHKNESECIEFTKIITK